MTAWAELWPDFAIQRIPCAERASAHGLIARNNQEELQDLKIDNEKENAAKKKDKKWKRKTKRCEILDCAFSANSDGLSIADMADDTQLSLEELMILKEESKILHDKISKLTLQEQFIIKSIYFEGMKQKEVAEILGVTKGALSQRLGTILRKMRTMYLEG